MRATFTAIDGDFSQRSMDVNAIDLTGIEDGATELEVLAAENVKRVVRSHGEQSPWEISAFLELKTVWHPVGT